MLTRSLFIQTVPFPFEVDTVSRFPLSGGREMYCEVRMMDTIITKDYGRFLLPLLIMRFGCVRAEVASFPFSTMWILGAFICRMAEKSIAKFESETSPQFYTLKVNICQLPYQSIGSRPLKSGRFSYLSDPLGI